MLIRPSFYSIFPPNVLNSLERVSVHLGDASGRVVQLRLQGDWVGAANQEQGIKLNLELLNPEDGSSVILNLTHRNLPLNLLMQVQSSLSSLSSDSSLRGLPAGNLTDFLLDQLSPGEMCSRLGSYVRDRAVTPTLLRPEYLSRLKVGAFAADYPSPLLQRNQTQTLYEKLNTIQESGACAGEIGHRQISALIEAVLGSYIAIEQVFKNPWCFAGAALPMLFSTQMAAWFRIACFVRESESAKTQGVLSSSRIGYPSDLVEAYLGKEDIPLIVAGGHQGLDSLLESYAQKRWIPFLKIPKRELHQDYLLRLIGKQLISKKDHWTSRGSQGRMARAALNLSHIRQCVPLIKAS